jgi:rhodanese-related sulfurtransferase
MLGMSVKRVTPPEAAGLVAAGWKYIDVRSIPEFTEGHPQGAYNVPLLHMVPGRGMAPNPAFEEAIARHFAKDDKLVLGCRSGGRSFRAVQMLQEIGFTSVVDMSGGWDGERDAAGRLAVKGWRDEGLPSEKAAPGRGWEDLK